MSYLPPEEIPPIPPQQNPGQPWPPQQQGYGQQGYGQPQWQQQGQPQWPQQQWHGGPQYFQGPPAPVQPNVRQAADRAQYVRQQSGHSILLHLFFGWMLFYIPTIYFLISPNHYWHL